MSTRISPERVRELLGAPNKHYHAKSGRLRNLGKHAKSVLSEEDCEDIRNRHDVGEKCESIAKDYGISIPYVSMIGNRLRRANDLQEQ